MPDYADELIDAAEEGKGFEECLKLIEEKWGPMQVTWTRFGRL